MAIFQFFKMAAVRHLGFSKVRNFTCLPIREGGKMRNQATFCADRSNRCRDMADFRFFKMRPSAILNIQKYEILFAHPIWRPNSYADRSNRRQDMPDFLFFTMAAVSHLGISIVRSSTCPSDLQGQNR